MGEKEVAGLLKACCFQTRETKKRHDTAMLAGRLSRVTHFTPLCACRSHFPWDSYFTSLEPLCSCVDQQFRSQAF